MAKGLVSFQGFDGIASKPDPPVEVILVIDELDLPAVQVSAAEHEVKSFLMENQGRLPLPVSIYRIDEWGLSESVPPSTDGQSLVNGIAHKEQARKIWASSMFGVRGWDRSGAVSPDRKNAVDPSSRPVFLDPAWNEIPHALVALGTIAIEERRRPGRKIMFWLGPGWEINHGRGKGYFDFVTELSTRLREARIDLWNATEWPRYDAHGAPTMAGAIYQDFFVPVKSEPDVTFGNLALQVVSTQTGGGVIQARNDLGTIIAKRVSEANKFYSLTFDPQRTAVVDEYRALQVEVDKPGLTAHTSSGYYDEPVFYDQPGVGERVTVEQLEQILIHGGFKSDTEAAQQLDDLELTERLSSTALDTWKSRLKGKRTRQALTALADRSAFLDPPRAEIPATPPPDPARQRSIILRTVDYVNKTIPALPDFFATRETAQYHEPEQKPGETWKTAPSDQSLHPGETLKATVRFRNGEEVSEGKGAWGKSLQSGERMLDVVGTFGPILTTVLSAATDANSELAWSRWEEAEGSTRAVFRYRVPRQTANLLVGFCCLPVDFRQVPFEKHASFHGEFAVDPETGTVLRLTVEADVEPRLPLDYSGIMVEYGPVKIGGTAYICPQRSVSISRQRTVTEMSEWGETFKVNAPFETLLNEASFSKFHRFRSTSRILPGFTPVPGSPQ